MRESRTTNCSRSGKPSSSTAPRRSSYSIASSYQVVESTCDLVEHAHAKDLIVLGVDGAESPSCVHNRLLIVARQQRNPTRAL